MTRAALAALLIVLITGSAIADNADGPDDGTHLSTSSQAFADSYESSMAKFAQSGFEATLETPGFGAMASGDIAKVTALIKAEKPIAGVSAGDPSLTYDVILQPGHYGRKKGKTGASGAKISERALAAHIVGGMASQLRAAGLKVLVVPADGSKRGLKAKIFLAVHADGSTKKCATGPSLGYAANSNPFAMHAIGMGLAHAFGYDYDKFRKDNFTNDEASYYMFHRVSTTVLTGLLEVGEITCAKSESRLISSSRQITKNVAGALAYLARLEAGE
jgi:N-acetylmuramoyl-L-alanine amidase